MSSENSRQATKVGAEPATEATGRTAPAIVLAPITPYYSLDAWRGLAALWVVMLHACLPYLLNGHRSLLWNPAYLVSVWGQLGVTVFFVISGYCITGAAYTNIAARKLVRHFCADRVRRIYPPYLAALLLTWLILSAVDFLQQQRFLDHYHTARAPLPSDFPFWISNLTLTQVPGGWPCLLIVAWSLCYEVTFYLIIASILWLGWWVKGGEPMTRFAVLLIGVGVLTCGSLAWLCVSPVTCVFPFKLWYQFGWGALLFLGVALRESLPGTHDRALKYFLRLSVAFALALTTLYVILHADQIELNQPEMGHPSTRVQAAATLVLLSLLYGLRAYDARLLKHPAVGIFARLGAFSYSLYLVHVPLLPFIDVGLRKLGFTNGWYFVPYILQIGVGVAAGWLFFQGVESRFISRRQTRRMAVESGDASLRFAAAPGQKPRIAAR